MKGIYTAITSVAIVYALATGCATSNMSAQEQRKSELDALLTKTTISRDFTPEPVVTETPELKPAPENPSIDLSQYLTNPEEEAKNEQLESKRNILEAREVMEKKYNSCMKKLENVLPPGATGECNGTERSEYITCSFNIEGQDYSMMAPTQEVKQKGFEIAYRLLIKENPELLKVMAEKHCQTKEIELNIEVGEVLSLR
jgi:hypothetical protein